MSHNGTYTAVAINHCGKCQSQVEIQSMVGDGKVETKLLLRAVNLTMTEETIELESTRRVKPKPKARKRLSFKNLSIDDV